MMSLCLLIILKPGRPALSKTSRAVEAQLLQSEVCFKTILQLYFVQNGFKKGNMLILHCLTVLAFMALRQTESSISSTSDGTSEKSTRSTLILAAKGLNDQGKNYFISTTIFCVLRSQMADRDRGILASYCAISSEDPALQEARMRHVKAQYPLNIANLSGDPEARWLENMVRKYEELAVQQVDSTIGTTLDSNNGEV